MNAEQVFKFYRAVKFFYGGKYDFKKYGGNMKTPPLINQPDRRYYYRIAQKLNDAQILALFTYHFFHKPAAYIGEMASPESLTLGLRFASRAENGRVLFEHELYELRKRFVDQDEDLDAWLYGDIIDGERASTPGCVQELLAGELPLDLACMLLLIPQPALDYDWPAHRKTVLMDAMFGNSSILTRLQRADQLIMRQRPGWRMMTHELATEFWTPFGNLAPRKIAKEATLFV